MDTELLIENIVRYCRLKGEFITPACVNAGVGKNFISNIKRGQVPSVEKVWMLAQYLGCTVSDLVGDKELTPAEKTGERLKDIMFLCEGLTDEQLVLVNQIAEQLKRQNK